MRVFFLLISIVSLSLLWFSRPSLAWAQAGTDTLPPEPTATPTPLVLQPPAALIDAYLPDLQPLPPFDLQLVANPSSGTRMLRFSNSYANVGKVALNLRGVIDSASLTVTLLQEVRSATGATYTQQMGGFEYHPEHGHWHWQGFSVYEIWSLGLNAQLDQPVVLSGKIGYCMMDVSRVNSAWLADIGKLNQVPIAGQSYTSCGWRRQGISPGWVDTYQRHLPGQSMDVSALPDGVYALRSVVDPEGLLAEADKSNNAALVYFRLEGIRLRVVDDLRFVRAQVFKQLYGDQPLFDEDGGDAEMK